MDLDLNGTNFSDTTFKPDNSTIREVRLWILLATKTKKVNTSVLPILRPEESNKDGLSDMLTKWTMLLLMELDLEDSRLENHSTSNLDYGCKELLLTIPTTMPTLLPSRLDKK
jgi:hypothetical protein